MAPEKRQFWQQITTWVTLALFIAGIAMAWQSSQSTQAEQAREIRELKEVQRTQWREIGGVKRTADEISLNLKVFMRSQGLEYQRVDQ